MNSNIIPSAKDEVELVITTPKDPPAAQPLNVGIIGRAVVDGVPVSERASTHAALIKFFPRMTNPPPELDGLIGLGIR